jgi:DNA-directed RNA polymerase specialized sigma24 family protein
MRQLLEQELPRLHALAYDMLGDRDDALKAVNELVDDAVAHAAMILGAAKPDDALLGRFARALAPVQEDVEGRRTTQSFMILDTILRSDLTRELDTEGVEVNIHELLWELKRTCLTRVIGCLPPSIRLSFILTDMLGYSPADAADLLEIKESAYRVRLTRARKRLDDYLPSRCGHVDRENACSCESRLGIAWEAKFLRPPPHSLDTPALPHNHEPPRRDMAALYRGLPRVALTPAQISTLLARVRA